MSDDGSVTPAPAPDNSEQVVSAPDSEVSNADSLDSSGSVSSDPATASSPGSDLLIPASEPAQDPPVSSDEASVVKVDTGEAGDVSSTTDVDNAPEDQTVSLSDQEIKEAEADAIVAVALAEANDVVNTGYVDEDTEVFTDVRADDNESFNHQGEPKDVEISYTFTTHLDPARQRDPHGVYTDDLERAKAEIHRARVEGREPDLDNASPVAGDVVLPTVVAQNQAQPGVIAPVGFKETVNVGVPADQVAYNSEAASQHGLNIDGSEKAE